MPLSTGRPRHELPDLDVNLLHVNGSLATVAVGDGHLLNSRSRGHRSHSGVIGPLIRMTVLKAPPTLAAPWNARGTLPPAQCRRGE